jgi:predicted phosphodiesterase
MELQLPVEIDDEYLRDDSDDIDGFLEGEQQIFVAAAPRRLGKTSFLKKIERRAQKVGWTAHYVSLDAGVACLAPVFGGHEVNAVIADAWCLALTTPTVLLIDEPNIAVFDGDREEAEAVKVLTALLRHSSHRGSCLKIVVAETEPFYQKCNEKCPTLGELFPMTLLYRLRPVTDARKREWLGKAAQFGSQVGPIPIELNHLKYAYAKGNGVESDVLFEYRHSMSIWYDRIIGSVFPADLDLLHKAATGKIRWEALTDSGRDAWRRLSVEKGYGFLMRDSVGAISVTSAEFKERLARVSDILPHDPVTPETQPAQTRQAPLTTLDQGFVIHQIADMHFGHFGRYIENGKKHVAECYIQFLRGLPLGRRPHVIVVCGDLSSTGDVRELDAAFAFLKDLTRPSNGPLLRPLFPGGQPIWNQQILVVPGNHDVLDRDRDGAGADAAADTMFRVFGDEFLTSFAQTPAIHFEPAGLTIALVNSAEETRGLHDLEEKDLPEGALRDGFKEIRRIMSSTYGTVKDLLAELDTKSNSLDERRAILREKIRFTAGYVGQDTLENLGRTVERAERNPAFRFNGKMNPPPPPLPETVRMAVCHHNISIASEASLFTDLVNSAEVRDCYQKNDLNVVLHGHQHRGLLTTEDRHGGAPRLHTIGTGALGACDAEPLFNEIVLDCSSPSSDKPNLRTMTIQPYCCKLVNIRNPRWGLDDVKISIEVSVRRGAANAAT